MKITRRIVTLLMAVFMLVGMSTTIFYAADNSHTITINNETSGHTYQAYQIFKGDISDGKLTNIQWGNGVVGAALLAKLKTSLPAYSECNTAEDVADVLSGFGDNSAEIDAFASIVNSYLANVAGESGAPTESEGTYSYNINVTGDGYYFVKDKDGSDLSGDAFTKYILKVVKDVTVNAKDDVPQIDKNINDPDAGKIKITNGSVGEVVNYVIDSAVPNMDGYQTYLFKVTDTMSDGLTFNNDIKVFIKGNQLPSDTFTVDTSGTDGSTFVLYINNFIQYKGNPGAPIVITYSATINQDAVVGSGSNDNSAHLEYSNNPSQSGPDPDNPEEPYEPNPNNPSGTTPDSVTKTYTTGIELQKVDASTGDALDGAKFKISGTSMKVVIINETIFKENNTDGTYYRLKDGTYTQTDPTGQGVDADAYESTTVMYEKVTVINKTNSSEPFETEGWVDSNGIITFDGLGEGTYTIEELVAPEGYNLLTAPVEVVVSFDNDTATWSAASGGSNLKVENGIVKLDVENKSGAELPSTGGIGTIIFYAVGGTLVVVACVLLIAKKRAKTRKED